MAHVVRKVTSDMTIKDHQVRASKDDPQYLVESDAETGGPRTRLER